MTTVKIDLLHETVLILTFDKKQNIGVLGMLKQAPQQVIVKGKFFSEDIMLLVRSPIFANICPYVLKNVQEQ